MTVIDADAHVVETERTWEFMDEAEQGFKPVTVVAKNGGNPGREYWLIGNRAFPKNENVGTGTSDASREMADVRERITHMDELSVDVQVLYPTLFLRPLTAEPDVDQALCRSYNRWLASIWKMGKGRLRWAVIPSVHRMDKALEEINFGKENGACGVFLRAAEGGLGLASSYFFPLYEEASKLNLPICVHASIGNFALWDQLERGLRFKLPVISTFHSVIMQRIPEKFPGLRWGFVEVSSQWVPYAMNDLAIRFRNRSKHFTGRNLLRERRMYVACQTTDDLDIVLDCAGDDSIVIGTDYGHHDTSSEIDALRKLKADGKISPAAVDKILGDNPKALYGF
ncbi:MAG: amidohydrolase family protein [Candidatus Binatia bacterium]